MDKEKRVKKRNVRRLFFIYGGLAWAVIHFIVFWVYINFNTLYNSFFNTDVRGNLVWNDFGAYKQAFKLLGGNLENGMANIRSVGNTVSIMLLALLINLPITLFFSYMILVKIKGHSIFRVGLYVPCVLSAVILCLFFKIMVSGTQSYKSIFMILEKLGYSNENIIKNGVLSNPDTAWPVILFVFSIWTGVNGNIIYFNSAMARLPESVLESAQLDGATQFRSFFSIVIPMIWPVITTMSVTLIGGSLSWFQPVQLMISEQMAAETKTGTVAWIIVSQVKGGSTVGFPAAFGIVISIIASVFILIFRNIMERIYSEVEY